MLVQTLHRILRGLSSALGATTGASVQAGRVLHYQDREFGFPLVAAAHYASGPVRRLVLGCERELATAVAERRPDAELPPTRSRAPERGLDLIGGDLRAALRTELERGPDMERFLVHDPGAFRAGATGARNFWLELRAAQGKLQVLLDLTPAGRQGAGERTETGAAPQREIPDAEERRRLLAGLVKEERDVQVLVPVPGREPSLWQGTVLAATRAPAPPGLILTSTCLGEPERAPAVGEPLAVLFTADGRLLQFESVLQGVSVLRLPAEAALPLLQVALPERIVPGQRRRSPRFSPAEKVEGTIRSLRPGLHEAGIRCVVRDLSQGGARVALTAPGILSAFRWGSEVACRFELPGQPQPLELVGRIRRVDLSRSGIDLRDAELGVEFDAGRPENEEPLKRLQCFVGERETVAATPRP